MKRIPLLLQDLVRRFVACVCSIHCTSSSPQLLNYERYILVFCLISLSQVTYAVEELDYDSTEVENTSIENNEPVERRSVFDTIFGTDSNNGSDSSSITLKEKQDNDSEKASNDRPIVTIKEPNEGKFLDTAIIKVIDRSLGKLSLVNVKINTIHRLDNLLIKIHKCWEPDQITISSQSRALVEISQIENGKPKDIFHAWMFAAHPAMSHVEHSKYDISLKACAV